MYRRIRRISALCFCRTRTQLEYKAYDDPAKVFWSHVFKNYTPDIQGEFSDKRKRYLCKQLAEICTALKKINSGNQREDSVRSTPNPLR